MSCILIGEVDISKSTLGVHDEMYAVVNYTRRGYVEIGASSLERAREIATKDFPFLRKVRIFKEITE